jgi:hypothetical protein
MRWKQPRPQRRRRQLQNGIGRRDSINCVYLAEGQHLSSMENGHTSRFCRHAARHHNSCVVSSCMEKGPESGRVLSLSSACKDVYQTLLGAPRRCSWQTGTARRRRCSSSSPCARSPKRCAPAIAAMLLMGQAAREREAGLKGAGRPRGWWHTPPAVDRREA